MSYIVDVRLNNNTIELVFDIINTQTDRLHSLLGDSDPTECSKQEEVLKTLFEIIKGAIRRKLKQKVHKNSKDFQLSSDDLFNDGNGSIRISNPPSQAQTKLIDSLLKVLFSQSRVSTTNRLYDAGHDNLVLSIFIENIFVETYVEKLSYQNIDRDTPLNLVVKNILNYKNDDEVKQVKTTTVGICDQCELYFYQLKDKHDDSPKEPLTEQFDRINIHDENDSTLTDENLLDDSLEPFKLNDFMFSKETLDLISITNLPDANLENIWENLYYKENLKQTIFNSTVLSLKLSEHRNKSLSNICYSDPTIKTNGLILLHGPPGTGKTSLCRAVCQKLSIRQNESLNYHGITKNLDSVLIELSCSQIFSRWFGESSKNITTIFKDIELLLKSYERNNKFVCLLIDEVETIASCRTKLISNNESNESVRVVNCLLTNLDKLKTYDNFIVLATSNYLDTLDSAFVDRADRIFHVTNPPLEALERILISTLENLLTSNILTNNNSNGCTLSISKRYQVTIRSLAEKCLTLNLSGRTLKKLPLVCLSDYSRHLPVDVEFFLIALAHLICNYQDDNH